MCARISFLTLLVLTCTFCCISCEEDQHIDPKTLTGRWELVQGFRNKKETATLAGTYFLFENGSKMKTNLPVGSEEQMEYELDKLSIQQKSSPPVKYEILTLNDTSLILGLELRGMQFELRLRRAEDVPSPESGSQQTWPYQQEAQSNSESSTSD